MKECTSASTKERGAVMKPCGGENSNKDERNLNKGNGSEPSSSALNKVKITTRMRDGQVVEPKSRNEGKSTKKKPWIPCSRRPSKPKPPGAILELDLSLVDPDKVCKKYPKSPSPSEVQPNINQSFGRRSKTVLKRQCALDKRISNSKDSLSGESLNSITSVTQLLNIERSMFATNRANKNVEKYEREETFPGVKQLAAKLQAKSISSSISNTSATNGESIPIPAKPVQDTITGGNEKHSEAVRADNRIVTTTTTSSREKDIEPKGSSSSCIQRTFKSLTKTDIKVPPRKSPDYGKLGAKSLPSSASQCLVEAAKKQAGIVLEGRVAMGQQSSSVKQTNRINGEKVANSSPGGQRRRIGTSSEKPTRLNHKKSSRVREVDTQDKYKSNDTRILKGSEEEGSFSASSSSSLSLSPQQGSETEQQPERIIPCITMSEYVEEKQNGTNNPTIIVAFNQSLFIPLQFIEPLKPTCDILEGSSLELKVRVRGAETVIWVKEDKLVRNAPPDFEYIEEKTDGVFRLKIADAFLEDAGLYICEALGAGGNEIRCWCQVHVREVTLNAPDVKNPRKRVEMSDENGTQSILGPTSVPSQVKQVGDGRDDLCEVVKLEKPALVRKESVKKSEKGKSVVGIDSAMSQTQNLSVNDTDRDKVCEEWRGNDEEDSCNRCTEVRRSSLEEVSTISYAEALKETVTDFASANAIKATGFTVAEEMQSEPEAPTLVEVVEPPEEVQMEPEASTPDAVVEPPEEVHTESEASTSDPVVESTIIDHLADDAAAEVIFPEDNSSQLEIGAKLSSQLSSTSDESNWCKEAQSLDEGAHFSTDEMCELSSLEVKSHTEVSEDDKRSPVDTPISEQNGRSSSVDSAIGFLGRPLFSDGGFPPRILMGPSQLIALYGEVVHLRVKVQNYGIPKTSVTWFKFVNVNEPKGEYQKIEPSSSDQSSSPRDAHLSIVMCGVSLSTLTISQINYDDCGRYRVKVQNSLGLDTHDCLLTVEGPPEPPSAPPKVKYDCKCKTILIQWSSCPYDGGSKITGYYVEASIINGSRTAINKEEQDSWQLLTPQSYSWLCYTLTNPKRGSVYRFRVFGENIYGKGKPTEASLPLLVPALMEGRRAGSSDALLWSTKSLSHEEPSSLLAESTQQVVHEVECEGERQDAEESSSSPEEEPIEYQNVVLKRDSVFSCYEKLDELGKGRFGVVFEVVYKETGKSYAGKFVKCIKAKDKERVHLEVKIMNDLGYHPKLICLIDALEMPREIVIVTQRINGGELFERVVADDFTLTEGDCITFLRQICDAVKFIHEKNIMHLDLKPENILCTAKNSNQIKIIDFGLAQYHDPKEPIRVLFGTAEFVSPEIINYEPIAPSTDNWSVGVITYILLSGLSPFMGDSDNETLSNITRAEFDFDDEAFEQISEHAKDFISNLIVKRPEQRMTSDECLNHRWLRQEGDNEKMAVILSTDKLKRFLVRRKWQKTGNAIRALGRITTLYSSRRSSTASSTTGSFSMSPSSPTMLPFSRTGSLATQYSSDSDNVFLHQTTPQTSVDLTGSTVATANSHASNKHTSPLARQISK